MLTGKQRLGATGRCTHHAPCRMHGRHQSAQPSPCRSYPAATSDSTWVRSGTTFQVAC
jgi:hypothetical protein